jgi:hypothetical protein
MVSTLSTSSKLSFFACVALVTSQAYAWSPGVGSESATSGFAVDTQSRNDVISFWHSVYSESEGYENRLGWTGSIGNNDPGSTSATFKNDVERRINYYRAMAGMDASIRIRPSSETVSGDSGPNAPEGTTKQDAAQAAAFMLSKNTAEFREDGGVSNPVDTHNPHNPPESWIADGDTARNGAYYSNVAIGHYGPGAIDAYISEDAQGAGGAENSVVGHRRYIFHSRLQEVATGDVRPTNGNYLPANALYVFGDWLTPSSSPEFICWPNSGFIPEDITPRLWSLSYPGADFSGATIDMQVVGGEAIATNITSQNALYYADNTIVWKATDISAIPSAEHADVTIQVTVSNVIINDSANSYNYSVTIINPNRLTDSPTLTGNTSPPQTGANYILHKIEHAEEYEFEVSGIAPITWIEGAEDLTSDFVIDGTSSNYNFRDAFQWNYNQSEFWYNGAKAFHLAFPNNSFPFSRETFTINRTIIPKAGGSMSFSIRRGYMSADSKLEVEYSDNGGGSWTSLAVYPGKSDDTPDNGFTTKNVNLASAGNQILIRFLLHQPTPTGVYDIVNYSGYPVGVYIDDIQFTDCEWLQSLSLTSLANNSDFATLDHVTGGGPLEVDSNYILRVRPRVGNVWMPFGQSLEVIPTESIDAENYQQWALTYYPLIGGFDEDFDKDGLPNGIEHILDLNPMNAADAEAALTPTINNGELQISHPVIGANQIEAEYSFTLEIGSWEKIPVTISEDGIATASVDLSSANDKCFIRWAASEL